MDGPAKSQLALGSKSCNPQTIFAGTATSIILGYDKLRSVAPTKTEEKLQPAIRKNQKMLFFLIFIDWIY